VRVAGNSFTLTATTAAQWLGALAMDLDGMQGIVPGLIDDEDLDLMWTLAQQNPDIQERWTNAARTALGRAGGRDWWWTHNLCRKALGTWIYTNGLLLRQNVDYHRMRFPDWLDACYTLYWQGADEETRIKLDLELSMRPRGVAVRQSPAQARQMAMDFAAD
jgi:hypothetical protein